MRILVFNWKDITHPFAGGAELHVHEQAKFWIKQGHSVTVFCPRYQGSKREEEVEGVQILRAGGRFSTYLLAPWYYWWGLRGKYDVIVDVENGIPFFTPLFSQKPKVVVMHHVHKYVFFRELPRLLAIVPFVLELYVMPFVYRHVHCIAVSESTKEETIKLGIPAKHITVIYNGVKGEEFRQKVKKERRPTIIYLGRMMKYKRLEILLESFKEIQQEIKNAQLHFVGVGPELENLKRFAQERKISNVRFFDFVTDKKKGEVLRRAWVFVTPSSLEGWGITVIEANACGLPAIAFNVPGLRESVKDGVTGYLVKDEGEMKMRIMQLLREKRMRDRLGRNAEAWSKHFSWDQTAAQTLKVLQEVIHERS